MLENNKLKQMCTLKISFPPDFLQRYKFFLTRSEIPWLFLDLKEFFSLAISSPVATIFDLLKNNSLQFDK